MSAELVSAMGRQQTYGLGYGDRRVCPVLVAGTLITAATAGVGILAAGPIFMGFAGMGAGAAAGGLAGALIGVGIPEAEAKFYAQEVTDKNAVLIGVEVTKSDRDMVRQILLRNRKRLGILAGA